MEFHRQGRARALKGQAVAAPTSAWDKACGAVHFASGHVVRHRNSAPVLWRDPKGARWRRVQALAARRGNANLARWKICESATHRR